MKVLELITKEDLEALQQKIDLLIRSTTIKDKENHLCYYTNDDLSRILNVSKRTLQNYRDEARIEFIQIGRKIYYSAGNVEKFMEKNKIKN